MAVLAFAAVGAFLAPAGYAALGWTVGSMLGSMLFAPSAKSQTGPRITDLQIQNSSYGQMIPIHYGNVRMAGNIVWMAPLIAVQKKKKIGKKKYYKWYEYYATFAISFGEYGLDPRRKITKVWMDGDKVFDSRRPQLQPKYGKPQIYFQEYHGEETQLADPEMEKYMGVGNVPAYRGQLIALFPRLFLKPYANRLPNIIVEVSESDDFRVEYDIFGATSEGMKPNIDNPTTPNVLRYEDIYYGDGGSYIPEIHRYLTFGHNISAVNDRDALIFMDDKGKIDKILDAPLLIGNSLNDFGDFNEGSGVWSVGVGATSAFATESGFNAQTRSTLSNGSVVLYNVRTKKLSVVFDGYTASYPHWGYWKGMFWTALNPFLAAQIGRPDLADSFGLVGAYDSDYTNFKLILCGDGAASRLPRYSTGVGSISGSIKGEGDYAYISRTYAGNYVIINGGIVLTEPKSTEIYRATDVGQATLIYGEAGAGGFFDGVEFGHGKEDSVTGNMVVPMTSEVFFDNFADVKNGVVFLDNYGGIVSYVDLNPFGHIGNNFGVPYFNLDTDYRLAWVGGKFDVNLIRAAYPRINIHMPNQFIVDTITQPYIGLVGINLDTFQITNYIFVGYMEDFSGAGNGLLFIEEGNYGVARIKYYSNNLEGGTTIPEIWTDISKRCDLQESDLNLALIPVKFKQPYLLNFDNAPLLHTSPTQHITDFVYASPGHNSAFCLSTPNYITTDNGKRTFKRDNTGTNGTVIVEDVFQNQGIVCSMNLHFTVPTTNCFLKFWVKFHQTYAYSALQNKTYAMGLEFSFLDELTLSVGGDGTNFYTFSYDYPAFIADRTGAYYLGWRITGITVFSTFSRVYIETNNIIVGDKVQFIFLISPPAGLADIYHTITAVYPTYFEINYGASGSPLVDVGRGNGVGFTTSTDIYKYPVRYAFTNETVTPAGSYDVWYQVKLPMVKGVANFNLMHAGEMYPNQIQIDEIELEAPADYERDVIGFIVPTQMTGATALQKLMTSHHLDAVESDNKIKVVPRGIVTPLDSISDKEVISNV